MNKSKHKLIVTINLNTFKKYYDRQMNNTRDKITLASITLFIDIVLMYILLYTHNTNIDKAFIYFYIIIHLVFYVVLILQCEIILDICHCFVFVGI